MAGILKYCPFTKSFDIYNFDTNQIKNMSQLFEDCGQLTSLNLANFVI